MIGKSIELDKMRKLRFSINALVEFQDVNGKDLTEELMSGGLSIKAIRNLLWAGLIEDDPSLTPSRVGDIMQDWIEKSGGSIVQLGEIVTEAVLESGVIPQAEDEQGN